MFAARSQHAHTGRVNEEQRDDDDDCSLRVLAHDFLTFAFILSMRPIHRPIHEMAIAPDKWDKMSPDEQQTARSEGKIRFPVSRLGFFRHSRENLFLVDGKGDAHDDAD